MADIEKLDQDEKDNDPIIEINEEANINYITVNKIRIGKVYFQQSLYMKLNLRILRQDKTSAMFLDTRRGGKKVTISTTTAFRPNLEDSKKYQTYGMN